jgi:hypothetical protein
MNSVHALVPHPDAPCRAVSAISVAVHGSGTTGLQLRYRVSGPEAMACLQTAAAGGRADGLWAHTCCELFVQAAGGANYREFNFSPRGAWAAYDFSDYRSGLQPAALGAGPGLQLLAEAGSWTLAVTLAAADLPPAGGAGELLLGICAVIEAPGGTLAYWALRHPSARPDFHHRDAFVIEWR